MRIIWYIAKPRLQYITYLLILWAGRSFEKCINRFMWILVSHVRSLKIIKKLHDGSPYLKYATTVKRVEIIRLRLLLFARIAVSLRNEQWVTIRLLMLYSSNTMTVKMEETA